MHDMFISNVSEIWPTKFLKTDVTNKNISRTDTSPSCRKHWKAYLILLWCNNFTFIQLRTAILHFPSKFSFSQNICSTFSKIMPPCLSKAWQTIYRWNSCLDHFWLASSPRHELWRTLFKLSLNTFRHRNFP